MLRDKARHPRRMDSHIILARRWPGHPLLFPDCPTLNTEAQRSGLVCSRSHILGRTPGRKPFPSWPLWLCSNLEDY